MVSQSNPETQKNSIGFFDLWREFLPLSLSDVTMAAGDPVMTTTLAHLPDARNNLAAVGIAKAIAVFFESPIIMVLHASNALAPNPISRQLFWKFVLWVGGGLSVLLILLSFPIVFPLVSGRLLGIPESLAPVSQQVIFLMGLWPFAIAWRRYFQGLLIHHGQSKAIAKASFWRLGTLIVILGIGWWQKFPGGALAGCAMVIGVMIEAIAVTLAARRSGVTHRINPEQSDKAENLPTTFWGVCKFYAPLGNSMMIVWGGRVLLVGLIARSKDAALALAAWTAAWGLVLVIANSTRMIQQIVIKYRHQVSDRLLLQFTFSAGLICSILLGLMANTAIGETIIQAFIGQDQALLLQIKPVLQVGIVIPLLIAFQNAIQGFLVSRGRTGAVNLATWFGTGSLLATAGIGVGAGVPGALAAAIAMMIALCTELACLGWRLKQ